MLTQSMEVMRYIRASAGRQGISVVFEDVNQPRHDGKTIYLPRITSLTTDIELKEMMASVDHEVAHDRYSSFVVLKEKSPDPKSLLLFVWNFLEDSRINNIEAREYQGFRENWDESSAILIDKIFSRAKKEGTTISKLTTSLLYWESNVSAGVFPTIEFITGKTKPNKKVLDVLNNFTDRLIDCHFILDKRLGTESTHSLAVDILEKLQKECGEEFKPKPKPTTGTEDEGGKDSALTSSKKSGGGEEKSDKDDPSPKKDDEYKIINLKLTEEDLAKFSITLPEHGEEMGKTGINFEPVGSSENHWDITDYSKFIVVDYPKSLGDKKYLEPSSKTKKFLKEYEARVEPKLVSQENFAQQVRKLIQIRSKAQMQYGVKRGKLDQSRLSRICFKAPGFNERVFKNKIENKILDSAVTVLVDMSGSMGGTKVQYALASTLLVNEVCSTLNIPVEILGFTDGYNASMEIAPVMFVYKNFSDLRIDNERIKGCFSMSSLFMYGNPDGENILWAHDRLVKRKEKKKLMIVMSDGSPAATKSSIGLENFTLKAIREIEASKNVDIYGLGLCSNAVEYFYKSRSVVNNPEDIPSKLLELIERKIVNV
jgi:cobalamin biosynthesis protein CobT